MFLHNSLNLRKQKSTFLVLLFFISVLVRIPVILIYGDTTIENEWNPLLDNLVNHGTLALKEFDGYLLPNLLMPPLYAYYLYLFTFLKLEAHNLIFLILFSQIILSSVSVIIFFKINKVFFSDKISFFSACIFSLFPIYLYSCAQISSITLNTFLSLLFFYFFFKIKNNKNIFYFSIISGLLILISREFTAILILSTLYLFFYFKLSLKKILLIFIITLITISPYLIRNYLIFDKFILHAGSGYNLWKGNNPDSKVEGFEVYESNKNLFNKINNIKKDKFYRIEEDKIFIKESLNNLKTNPKKYMLLYMKKAISFYFVDIESSNDNYYNPINYIPILIISLTSFFGILLSNKKSLEINYLILIISFYILVFSIFAILPRYKIYILPMQLIFTNIFIQYFLNKINSSWQK